MNFLLKLIRTPSKETVLVEAHDTWRVTWWSMQRTSEGNLGRSNPRVEVFNVEQDAKDFATRLTEAAQLLGDVNDRREERWGPFLNKNQYKGIERKE